MDKNVLIIEDDNALGQALNDKFLLSGFKTTIASDGEEGLIKALSIKPSLIVLDLTMPKKSGWEVLEELRKDSWGIQVPVIILTNSPIDDSNNRINQVVEYQPAYYFLKTDIKLDYLIDKVKEILK